MNPWPNSRFYDDTSLPRVHPAFTDREVAFFAPLLTLGLSKATPEEVVTFYQTRNLSALDSRSHIRRSFRSRR